MYFVRAVCGFSLVISVVSDDRCPLAERPKRSSCGRRSETSFGCYENNEELENTILYTVVVGVPLLTSCQNGLKIESVVLGDGETMSAVRFARLKTNSLVSNLGLARRPDFQMFGRRSETSFDCYENNEELENTILYAAVVAVPLLTSCQHGLKIESVVLGDGETMSAVRFARLKTNSLVSNLGLARRPDFQMFGRRSETSFDCYENNEELENTILYAAVVAVPLLTSCQHGLKIESVVLGDGETMSAVRFARLKTNSLVSNLGLVCRADFQMFCSVPCWEIHKIQPCAKPKEIVEERQPESHSFRTEDTVSIDKLKLLSESEGVLSTLRNPHVRSILEAIDRSKNPSASLKLAMLEPIFVEFVDECLKVVEPAENETF